MIDWYKNISPKQSIIVEQLKYAYAPVQRHPLIKIRCAMCTAKAIVRHLPWYLSKVFSEIFNRTDRMDDVPVNSIDIASMSFHWHSICVCPFHSKTFFPIFEECMNFKNVCNYYFHFHLSVFVFVFIFVFHHAEWIAQQSIKYA